MMLESDEYCDQTGKEATLKTQWYFHKRHQIWRKKMIYRFSKCRKKEANSFIHKLLKNEVFWINFTVSRRGVCDFFCSLKNTLVGIVQRVSCIFLVNCSLSSSEWNYEINSIVRGSFIISLIQVFLRLMCIVVSRFLSIVSGSFCNYCYPTAEINQRNSK